jgi:hypothetical protein
MGKVKKIIGKDDVFRIPAIYLYFLQYPYIDKDGAG